MKIQKPKGTKDILPEEIYKWDYIINKFKKTCNTASYKQIIIPTFEHTELYERGVGDTTDIVQKEMYTFLDKGNRSITLRPESTAGVVRAFVENGMNSLPMPIKLFYIYNIFRYENVQKGRYREHNQFGFELFGSKDYLTDVEIIAMANNLFNEIGLKDISLEINNIGCPNCRPEFNKKFKEFLSTKYDSFCDTCKIRFNKNPMRILDCKEIKCQELIKDAPRVIDNLCNECSDHFKGLQKGLDNLNINYKINPNIVRGQDYYTKTVFEFITDTTLCGGGRYDGLVELLDGSSTPAVGFGAGIERILLEIEKQKINICDENKIDLFLASIGDEARLFSQKMANSLRNKGIVTEYDICNKSLKAQFKYADKIGAKYIITIGENELMNNKFNVKNMITGEEKIINNIEEFNI